MKKTLFLIVTMMFVFLFGTTCFAAEKTITVPIDKEYLSLKFTLTFDYYDDYSVTIKSPDGNSSYTPSTVSDNTLECVVSDSVPTGNWTISISKEDIVNEDGSTEETVLSPVSVKAEGSSEKIIDATQDIKVATDIAGLKMYFKDDNFIAEWTDTTCGDIQITVTNAENMEKLASETISGSRFELPLDKNVNEISVSLVPSVSSSVEGAEKTYSLKFDNHPSAEVSFEDLSITNKDTIETYVKLSNSYSVSIYVNDKEVESTDTLPAGEYTYDIPIEVGENNILVYIVDSDGNMRSTPYSIEKDVVAPILRLTSSYSETQTYEETLTIDGEVEDYDYLTVNGKDVEVNGDNTFSYPYKLKEGVNDISIVASDVAGNEAYYNIEIERLVKEEKEKLNPFIFVGIMAFIVVIAIIIYKTRKNFSYTKTAPKPAKVEKKYNVRPAAEKKQTNKKLHADTPPDDEERTLTMAIDNYKKTSLTLEIIGVCIPIIFIFVLFKFIVLPTSVESGSMEPTLKVGNTVFFNRLAYTKEDIQRGDIISFWSEEEGLNMSKRVIGIAGDEISFRDGFVVINGQYVDETAYLDSDIESNCTKTFTVPEGTVFVLGDNREDSFDSRYWENPYIPISEVQGKYLGQIAFSF